MWIRNKMWTVLAPLYFENEFLEIEIFQLNITFNRDDEKFKFLISGEEQYMITCSDYSSVVYEVEKFFKKHNAYDAFSFADFPMEEEIKENVRIHFI